MSDELTAALAPAVRPLIATALAELLGDGGTIRPVTHGRAETAFVRLAHRAYQQGRTDAIAELLTTEQVADALGLSVGRVRVLARDRQLGWRIKHDILFRPEDLAALQNRQPGRPRKVG